MSAPLAIEWVPQDIDVPEQAKALVVKDPNTVVRQFLGLGEEYYLPPQGPLTTAEFFKWLQAHIVNFLNGQLAAVQVESLRLQEERQVQFRYLQQATQYMLNTAYEYQRAVLIQAARPLTQGDEMEWEVTPTPRPLPSYLNDLRTEVAANRLHPKPEEEDADDHRDMEERERREGTHPPPLPGNRGGFRAPSSAGSDTGTIRPLQERSLPPAGGGESAGLPPAAGGSGGMGGPPIDRTGRRMRDKPHSEDEEEEAGGDSDEVLKKVLIKFLQRGQAQPETPKPQPFKGDPEDLERFLRQLENVWAIEKVRYRQDIVKIRYAANLLHRNTTDKHRDPVAWYEAYHPKIDLAAARRLPNGRNANLDPHWARWDTFVSALRSSFSSRVGREQAVTQWAELTHTDSIDDFLDRLTNLMWRTGYSDDVAKDKLVRGLNREIGQAWATYMPKPHSLHEQMAALRDLGHQIEEYKFRTKKSSGADHHSSQSNHPASQKRKREGGNLRGGEAPQGGNKKPRSGGKPKEWKDREAELKGIPRDILDERASAENCLKCGKANHKWFECYTKEPVTKRVTAFKKSGIPKVQATKGDVKISAVKSAEESEGRIVELVEDSDGDYVLLK